MGMLMHRSRRGWSSVERYWREQWHWTRSWASGSDPQVEDGHKIYGGCLLSRLPYVNKKVPQWEVDYENFSEEWKKQKGHYKETPAALDIDVTTLASNSNKDDNQELDIAPLETEADRKGDRRTIKRRLDEPLYLLLQDRDTDTWHFPYVENREDETIRATAVRALETFVKTKGLETYVIGNAPCALLPQTSIQENQVFLVLTQLIKGSPSLVPKGSAKDFAWVARDEVGDYFEDEETKSYLLKLLEGTLPNEEEHVFDDSNSDSDSDSSNSSN